MQWQAAEQMLPFLGFLEAGQRVQLREMAKAFLSEKQFYGARGLKITDQMMLVTSLQACLPVFRLGLAYYRNWLGIILYPGAYVAQRSERDANGLVHESRATMLGEAWPQGPVVLAWDEQLLHRGSFVAIHEFSHKLDMANGPANGSPPLPANMAASEWKNIFSAAYVDLKLRIQHHEPIIVDAYAGKNPAEFFAVTAETFFSHSMLLKQHYPDLYTQFSLLFGLDPTAGVPLPQPAYPSGLSNGNGIYA